MIMDKTSKNKWQVRGAALVIFVLGFTAGALAWNAYKRFSRSGVEASRQDRFEQMLDRLQLSVEQKTQVHQILGDTRSQLQALRKETEPRFDEIRRQADERLQKVLTPEQWKQFQQERNEMRNRGRRGRDGEKK
jgi:Spy/CpxP family protein refolding chaperone